MISWLHCSTDWLYLVIKTIGRSNDQLMVANVNIAIHKWQGVIKDGDVSSQRRLGRRSSGRRSSREREKWVLNPSNMDCVEDDEFLDTHIDHTICIDWWKLSKEAKRKEFRRKEVRKEKELRPQTIKNGLCGKIRVFRHPYQLYYLYWVVEASKGG